LKREGRMGMETQLGQLEKAGIEIEQKECNIPVEV
jgi:hypothetical protein